MDPPTLRKRLARVLGPGTRLRRWRVGAQFTMYAGVFSLSVLNGDIKEARILLATVPGGGPGDAAPLEDLPWVVLQLHRMDPGCKQWAVLAPTLAPDLDPLLAEGADRTPADLRCTTRVSYDPAQDHAWTRALADPGSLADLRVAQRREPSPVAPLETLDRRRVEFTLQQRRAHETEETVWEPVRGVQLFVERCEPRHPVLGRRVHQETGLARESTLAAALNEWRTWIVLG